MISKLFRNPKKAQVAIFAFVIALLCTFATKCRSAELAFEAGSSVIRGYTPSVGLSLNFDGPKNVGRDHQDFSYECGLFLNGETDRAANNFGAHCMVVDGFKRLDLGLGLAYLQNTDSYNGSNLNFSLLARWRITDRWYVSWHHISNSGTKMPNLGRDMLRVGLVL